MTTDKSFSFLKRPNLSTFQATIIYIILAVMVLSILYLIDNSTYSVTPGRPIIPSLPISQSGQATGTTS